MVLAFETGCPTGCGWRTGLRIRGEMPERIIEITSYRAMLGCVVAGMEISLLPRMVLSTFLRCPTREACIVCRQASIAP